MLVAYVLLFYSLREVSSRQIFAGRMVAVLHNIRSIHNVGSIFRTGEALGVSKIYLCGFTPAPIDRFGRMRRDFMKVALGAERTVKWESVSSTTQLLTRLRKEGRRVYSVEQDSRSCPYDEARVLSEAEFERIALVVGDEVKGLSEAILKKSDEILEIPMRGAMIRDVEHPRRTGRGKESLNVSVAFGIVAYRLREARN